MSLQAWNLKKKNLFPSNLSSFDVQIENFYFSFVKKFDQKLFPIYELHQSKEKILSFRIAHDSLVSLKEVTETFWNFKLKKNKILKLRSLNFPILIEDESSTLLLVFQISLRFTIRAHKRVHKRAHTRTVHTHTNTHKWKIIFFWQHELIKLYPST